jgi:hypothetical protein
MKVEMNFVLVRKGVMVALELTSRGELWRRDGFFGNLGDLMKNNGRIHFFCTNSRRKRDGQSSGIDLK